MLFHSSIGIVVGQHYCKGELKDIKFFASADNCHTIAKKTAKKACPFHQQASDSATVTIDKKPCCSDKTDYFSADIDQLSPDDSHTISQQIIKAVAIAINSFSSTLQFTEIVTHSANYKDKPPLPYRQKMTAYLQTFLL